ncbi:hypothetical protein PENARI_c002G06669 [Penicillium arizonense]|uniref:Glycosyl hydrolase family 59 C-terminal lectin domain-containing protein n=1 Tax=Penicillium arizonense TaxID=1835702 RepID=A0A1F5LW31_PENAI|nr:hypothetical protein PENARI_c002G06669 [Penicillium arizonense]OGE57141.1 hypothetical protein PENARI_c002G06669 [Penicillium arizonense]
MFNPRFRAIFVFSFLAAVFISPVVADSTGSFLWDPTVDNEINTYARVIELQHAGDKNGRLLATWEHTYTAGPDTRKTNGTAAEFIIRKSEDEGETWTTLTTVHDTKGDPKYPYTRFEQPFFFEFPRQMGKYPEGTLLLVGNLLPSNGSTTNFFAWRSEDHGETWDAVGEWQHGGPSRSGIWEPFLYMDKKGRLVEVFSEERQNRMHSQMLVNVVSEDGGDTWGDVVKAVASSRVRDRPGMASVAKMGNGEYIMSYEFCGHPHCPVYTKASKDGVSWNTNDTGIRIDTADGIHPVHSPYTIWDPSTKQVILSSHYTLLNSNNQPAPENSRSVFINKNYGKGEWFWAPAPWTVPNGTRYCKANYSPDLLPLSNGVVRYTAPAGQGNSSFCSERTGKAPIGALPYTANFTAYGQTGWIDFGGKWNVSGDEYGFEPVGSTDAVSVTGSTGWKDYKITGDVIITGSSGSVGLNVRMSASGTGLNKLKGYAVAVDSATGKLTTYRHADTKTVMHSEAHPGGIQGKKWYHLSVVAKSDKFTVTLAGEQGGSKTTYTVTDGSFKQGMAGVFGNNGGGNFKNIQITN